MKLITKLSILLLINFVAGSTRLNLCAGDYANKVACWKLLPNTQDMFRDANTTAETFTGTDDQINTLRSTVRNYCESGSNYFECWDALTLSPQCNPTDPVFIENRKLGHRISKFLMEYTCRNDGETVLKLAANNGIKSLIDYATSQTFERCFEEVRDNFEVASETFCRYGDAASECLQKYTDTLQNQDISGILRDLTPQLKALIKCDAVAA